MKTIVNIFDVILEIIDSMRLTGDVSNIVNVSGNTYTFETNFPENCIVGKFITFDNDNEAEITAVNGLIITIECYYNNVPVAGLFKRNDPYSGQDLSKTIAAKYSAKSTDPISEAKQRFPAIEIVRDKIESEENTYNSEAFESLRVMFINNTNPDWSGDERNLNNYKGTLTPLANEFTQKISQNQNLIKKHEIRYSKKYLDKANYNINNKNAINHFVDMILIDIKTLVLDTFTEC